MKISIITVCFNSAETIAQTIESIKAQTYKDLEYIVIDGGSVDMTLEILKSYQDIISVWISEPDTGIYDAMNKGISYASGDVIGFLNADDFYAHHHALTAVGNFFKDDPTRDACFSDLIYVDQFDHTRTVRYWQSKSFSPGAFSRGWCPPHPTFFARRSVYERFGCFALNYRIAADVELMMRFLEVGRITSEYLPGVLVKMRMGGTTNKSWRNVWSQNQEVLQALRIHGLPTNALVFFAQKLLSRVEQFFVRP